MRRGEIFALHKDDVDFTNHVIKVRKTMVKTQSVEWIIDTPKNTRSIRDIQTDKFVTDRIKKYIQEKSNPFESLIYTDFKPGAYTKRFNRLLDEFGLPKIRFHDLRH